MIQNYRPLNYFYQKKKNEKIVHVNAVLQKLKLIEEPNFIYIS